MPRPTKPISPRPPPATATQRATASRRRRKLKTYALGEAAQADIAHIRERDGDWTDVDVLARAVRTLREAR